jgi:hypothetical protein
MRTVKQMSTRIALACLLLSACASSLQAEGGVRRLQFLNYPDCIELSNKAGTVAVLGHHVGGRVLSYRQGGKESLYLNSSEEKWTPENGKKPSSAGRFDIGPEYLIPKRAELWSGQWSAKITGPRSARLTSKPAADAGIRLIRDFVLAENSSHLACTQTMVNTSGETRRWCHWGRMFAIHGGIGVVPLTPKHQRFPKGYIMMRGSDEMLILPEDPNIRRRGNFLEILAPPKEPKLGFDSFAGWFAYQMPNDLAFIKTYKTYPGRLYGEIAGLTLSIWYPKSDWVPACEIEPIGPMEILQPGQKAAFTENWYLLPNRFPKDGSKLDLSALAKKVAPLLP